MKKYWLNITLTLTIVIAFVSWSSSYAEGNMTRGIYVNSQVHYLSVGADATHQVISHQAGTVDPTIFFLTLGAAVTQTIGSCTPDAGGVSMNGAVFDNKIFFAFTGNPGCNLNPAAGDTHLCVAAYDLTNNTFPNPVADLGAVYHTDTLNTSGYVEVIDMASAALVVFNNLLYVFSDNKVYTSGDGVNWSSYPVLQVGGNNMEPLDAITFYSPDADPMIMIIYGNYTTGLSTYTSLYAATWNGQFGAASVLNGQNIPIGYNSYITGQFSGSSYFTRALLFAGTASPAFKLQPGNGTPGFSAGAKTPSLQLFLCAAAMYSTTDGTSSAVRRLEYNYTTTGGKWTVDPEVFVPNGGYGYGAIYAFPWFKKECATDNNIQRQYLVINAFDSGRKTQSESALYFRHGSPEYRHPAQLQQLEGTLPTHLEYFGDMSFSVNGYQIDVPLISHEIYEKALAGGRTLVHKARGVKLTKAQLLANQHIVGDTHRLHKEPT